MHCVHCGRDVEAAFRFCPWCGAVQRRKLVEFFPGHAGLDAGRALRVSRYLRTPDQEPHVRFSVWDRHGRARAVVSLDEDEAERLGAFLQPLRRPGRLREALESLIGHPNE
jgi:zinc-ribbon domain